MDPIISLIKSGLVLKNLKTLIFEKKVNPPIVRTVTNFCGFTANYTSEVKTEVATIFGPYLNLRAAQHLEEILGEKEERKSVCPF